MSEYTCERCGKTLPLNVRLHRLDTRNALLADVPQWQSHECVGSVYSNRFHELPPAKEVFVGALVWLVRWMRGVT